MSEVTHPVGEQVAPTSTTAHNTAVPAAEPVTVPAVSAENATVTHQNGTEVAAANDTVAAAAPVAQDNIESSETAVGTSSAVTEGILGYKAPGLVKSFRFVKKYFWFGDEAVDAQQLAGYLRSEKQEISHANAAHATQTGKGLLFIGKRVEDKAQPSGVLNLGEASDVYKEGQYDFSMKLHGQKHTFQASSSAERDQWFAAIETKVAEAKSAREGIVGSEGYKHQIENFGKPSTVAGLPATISRSLSGRKKSTDRNAEIAAESTAAPVDEGVTTKRKDKSRSQSRKRASIFGALLGKKEDHEENKDLKRDEEKPIERSDKTEGVDNGATLDAAAVAARVMNEPVLPVEGAIDTSAVDSIQPASTATEVVPTATTTTREQAPKPSKRNSLFGSLFNKVSSPSHEKAEKDVVPVVPAKDTETTPVSSVAPQIGDPVETSAASTKDEVDHVTPGATDTKHPLTSSSPPKGGIFAFMRGNSARNEKKDVEAEEQVDKKVDEPTVATENSTAPNVATPETPAQETVVPATTSTPDAVKEKRRTSLFGTLGGKKERKNNNGNEATESESKPKSSSNKLGSIFRRPSRAARADKDATRPEASTPSTADDVNKSATPVSGEAPAPVAEPTTSLEHTTAPQANGVAPAQSLPVQAAA